MQGCQQSDLFSAGHLQICRYGDCKTPADKAKYNHELPGQSTDSISADMEIARLQQTRPNTTLAFQVSQLTVYLPIWRLQDSSRPGQTKPWHSRSVNLQYLLPWSDMNEFVCQATYIACWSVNADHSLQLSQKEGLAGHGVLQSELAGQTTVH
jgi:hypothetical protein